MLILRFLFTGRIKQLAGMGSWDFVWTLAQSTMKVFAAEQFCLYYRFQPIEQTGRRNIQKDEIRFILMPLSFSGNRKGDKTKR